MAAEPPWYLWTDGTFHRRHPSRPRGAPTKTLAVIWRSGSTWSFRLPGKPHVHVGFPTRSRAAFVAQCEASGEESDD